MSARFRWVAAAAVVVVAGASGSYVALSGDGGGRVPTRTASEVHRAPALPSLSTSAPVPDPASMALSLRATLRDPAFGGTLDAEVVDAATGRELLARNRDATLPPASTAKLLTAVAALETLGPGATLTTGVVRSGTTLYLIGGGDVTLAATESAGYPPRASLAELAAQTARAVGGAGPFRLCVDTSAWTGPARAPGWTPTYFTEGDIAPLTPLELNAGHLRRGARARSADPAHQAAAAYARMLRPLGVRTQGQVCRAPAPASGLGVASVASAPVSALVQRMLTDSDNDLAEALGRAVAARAGRSRDFAGAAAAVTAALARVGVAVDGLRLYDASGLSRLDRVTPRALVQVLQVVASSDHPELRSVADALPVAGLTGTLGDRYRRGPAATAAGLVRAKTGTLAGVNTLAGYVVDVDGRLLVFAFLTDRAAGPDATEAALDRLASAVASCGCR